MSDLDPAAIPPELASLLGALLGPRILVDTEFRILAANGAYYQEYGDDEGLIGRTCYEVSHHFDRPCDQCGESCPRAMATQSGRTSRVLHLHHTPQGEEYVDVELIPLRGEDGNLRYFIEGMTPLRERAGERPLSGMVGRSPAFNRMLELLHRVAPRITPVLLLGESGTGKELAAQTLHQLSPRAGKPFVPVDCSGMSESLFESELFGHEKGAFTGASQRKTGLVEAAAGGTLFLDELGDIPLNLQVKLLRLLETGSFRRVGSVDILRADFRLVAATHRDLAAMVAAGTFRQDLYYRLAAFPIPLPPLRERREDLALLMENMLQRLSPNQSMRLAPEAMERLARHDFPGNIRELRNILERGVILADGDVIQPEHLLPLAATVPPDRDRAEEAILTLEEMERRYLEHSLARLGGDKDALAQRLGISRRTINRKLQAALAATSTPPAVNLPPVANAGPDLLLARGARAVLNGSASFDPDGSIASYAWVSSNRAVVSIIAGAATATPTVAVSPRARVGTVVTLTLTVSDNKGLKSSDEMKITVK